jgi:hypothetical protein
MVKGKIGNIMASLLLLLLLLTTKISISADVSGRATLGEDLRPLDF